MNQDPDVRQEAAGVLNGLFHKVGQASQDPGAVDALQGLGGQVAEFITMPADLARIFVTMSMDLTELVLTSLADAGYVLVKGMTPA